MAQATVIKHSPPYRRNYYYILDIILLSVYCWNGHQLLVRLLRFLHPLCLLRLPRHLPLAFQQDPFGFSQKEKVLSQNPLGKSQKELAEKPKERREERGKERRKERGKIEQEAVEQSSKDLITLANMSKTLAIIL